MSETTPTDASDPVLHERAQTAPSPPGEDHSIGAPTPEAAARRVAELGVTTARELRDDSLTPEEGLDWALQATATPDAQLHGELGAAKEQKAVLEAVEEAQEAFDELARLGDQHAVDVRKVRGDQDLTRGGQDRRVEVARQQHLVAAAEIVERTFGQSTAALSEQFGRARADLKLNAPDTPSEDERRARRSEGLTLVQLAAAGSGAEGLLALIDRLHAVGHPSLPDVVEVVSLLPGVDPLELEARLRVLRRERMERLDRILRAGDKRLKPLVRMAVIDRLRTTLGHLGAMLLEDPFDEGRRSLVRERLRKAISG